MKLNKMSFFYRILSPLSLICLMALPSSQDLRAEDKEVWTFEAHIRPAFLKSVRKNVLARASRQKSTRRASRNSTNTAVNSKLLRLFAKQGFTVTEQSSSSSFRLNASSLKTIPSFVKILKPLSHTAYLSDDRSVFLDKGIATIKNRSIDPCPSVPDATECNGFTNDPIGNWGFNPSTGMAVNEGWKLSTGANVIVAILSTGVNFNHPDLINNVWSDPSNNFAPGESIHGYNAYANTPPNDSSETGTALAGIVAATANNSIGGAGVAYNSKIMIVKGYDEETLSKQKVIDSMNYVLKKKQEGHNIRVLLAPNFYFGYSPGLDPDLLPVVQALNAQGILIVSNVSRFESNPNINVDAGYNGFQYFPFNFTTGNILNTSSYKHGDFQTTLAAPQYSSAQNFGPSTIHISTPGELVYTTTSDGSYSFWSGGGIAAANGAGAAALLFSKVPSLTPQQVVTAFTSHSREYPASFGGKTISEGALDVGLAINFVSPSPEGNGDFNDDGCVDGSDFMFWQRTFGSTVAAGTAADANNNGEVDSDDLAIWKQSFGQGC